MNRVKLFSLILIFVLVLSGLAIVDPTGADAKTHRAKTTKTGLNDTSFVATSELTATEIQNILAANGSFLRNYREGGRSAAQIIYDAAQGHGDASGTMYGIRINHTVSPVVLLAMLQKEQSLITMSSQNDNALRVAMGYGCPDGGGSDPKYHGFTKQVENAAWQLRYNYERAKGQGFTTYQVGQSVSIDGSKIKIASRWQSALLRYTPHSYSNFVTYFNRWSKSTAVASSTGVVSSAASDNCLVGSKSTRRLCRIAQAKATATDIVTAAVNPVTTTDNCLVGSKSTRRLCRIAQAKATATGIVNSTISTITNIATVNCGLGPKSVQRACRIQQAKLAGQAN